jgi:hypothetical protein
VLEKGQITTATLIERNRVALSPIRYHCRLEVIERQFDYRGLIALWDTDRTHQKILYFSLRNLRKHKAVDLKFYTDSVFSECYAQGQGPLSITRAGKTGKERMELSIDFVLTDVVRGIVVTSVAILVGEILADSFVCSQSDDIFVREGDFRYTLDAPQESSLRTALAHPGSTFIT